MTTKHSKGYTKQKTDLFKIYMEQHRMFTKDMLKDPNEPLDKWIIRKSEEQIYNKQKS